MRRLAYYFFYICKVHQLVLELTARSQGRINTKGGGGHGNVEATTMKNTLRYSSSKILSSAQVFIDIFLVLIQGKKALKNNNKI